MWEQTFQLEAKHLAVQTNIKNILNRDINGLGTLQNAFLALTYAQLTGYGTGDKLGSRKTDESPKQLGLFHYFNPLSKLPVF